MDTSEIILELFDDFSVKMDKSITVLKNEFQGMRAGRANPHILDKIVVDYYGTPTPLPQMANISVPDARSLVISLWDASALKSVDKAIQESNLGINPTNDGKVLRLVFPELTEERRKDLVKLVKKMGEDGKIALRNLRRDTMDALKKMKTAKQVTEDEYTGYEKDVEKTFGKFVESMDLVIKSKEKELMTV